MRPLITKSWHTIAFLIVAMFLFVSCGTRPAVVYKLSSGKTISVIQISQMAFPEGVSYIFKYRTAIPISDLAGLNSEAQEILPLLQPDLERLGIKSAIIQASDQPENAIVSVSHVRGVVFQKQNDGTWKISEASPAK